MADFTTKNVDFTNGRPYNQAEHRRALDSCWGSYVNNGLDFTGNESTCTLTAGSGICKGYPFQFTGTYSVSNSGTYYVYVEITATIQNDNSGTATASILLSTNSNMSDSISNENNQTLYFKIYKIVNGVVDTDYRHQQTLKSVKLKETSNQWGLTVNGVDSNLINKPNATLPGGITEYKRTSLKSIIGGFYGGETITIPSNDNLWNYDAIVFTYKDIEPYAIIDFEKLRAIGKLPPKGSTSTATYVTTFSMQKNDSGFLLNWCVTVKLSKNNICCFVSNVHKTDTTGKTTVYVNTIDYAIKNYALLERKY